MNPNGPDLPPRKAVRDKIPEIIRNSGEECQTKVLSDEDFYEVMKEKLTEEVEEYLADPCPEELADIIEVIYRLAAHEGISVEELEEVRLRKRKERGGFEGNVFLCSPGESE
ncbi:nucleoside triphosphate pyrophosphohydrolase [Methanoplanus limicola]|uniref:Phosphoribosyl-ATP pyrophosphohydrolase n=1 Tax=Methanoplanus limicola DSM 2279 TaxID=937775 RepID=H1Z085_9EURY|nr:nucleoside triphosphate pyrophosphohydrolase [Methanoplanus limicola]EHQ36177.1 hypothetical protein Metlim_2093 [Methanoplanus limicola DSM 2279]